MHVKMLGSEADMPAVHSIIQQVHKLNSRRLASQPLVYIIIHQWFRFKTKIFAEALHTFRTTPLCNVNVLVSF